MVIHTARYTTKDIRHLWMITDKKIQTSANVQDMQHAVLHWSITGISMSAR